jgi:hypothetical protein
MAKSPSRETAATATPKIPPDEQRRIIHAFTDRHYRALLDEPIPVLDDMTPRQAAMSSGGRDKLVAWLKRLENQMAKHEASAPMADYDVGWMWEALGVAHLRD